MDDKIQTVFLRALVRIVFHALPIAGVLSGRFFLTAALFGMVFLAYVKTRKIREQLVSANDADLKEELERAKNRWEYLTFGN